MKRHRASAALGTVVVALCAFGLLFMAMAIPASIYDEGIVLTFALQTMHGAVVHRDFHSEYGPGSYTTLAALFSLFGPSFLLARLFAMAVQAWIVTMVLVLLRTRTRAWIAYGAAAICAAWLIACGNYLYPTFPCLALALCGAALLLRPGALQNPRVLFVVGCCCGLSAYFRYDTGFFTLLADSAAVVLSQLKLYPGKKGRWLALRAVLILGAGAAAIFVPGALAYLLTSPLRDFLADVVDYPLHFYVRMRGLPFPRPAEILSDPALLLIYLPLLAVACALPMTCRDWLATKPLREGSADSVALASSLLFSLLALVLYYKGVVRVSVLHMLLAMVPALILLALLVNRWWSCGGRRRIAAAILVAVTFFSTAASIAPTVRGLWLVPRLYAAGLVAEHAGLLSSVPYPSRTCRPWSGMRFTWLSPSYALTAYYLARHSEQGERILVAPDRNDRFYVNPLMLYFAAGRLPGTRYAEYDPGLQNRADIQQTMIAELARNDVRFIVRDASFDAIVEPNASARSSGVFLLDNYIDSHYRPVAASGKVQILLRNDAPSPSTENDPLDCRLDAVPARKP